MITGVKRPEAEVQEVSKLKASDENTELLKEKLLEEKGRRERGSQELAKLQCAFHNSLQDKQRTRSRSSLTSVTRSGDLSFSDLKDMETPCSGMNEWSEGFFFIYISMVVDEIENDNLDLLVVPQYGRNLNHIG
ncbi:hypothetical protein WN944_005757 [Citrus x changshan-huyou]|uniref:Uncharacterized protein n=1 Tax=Citrus x changshan-huyou TaxID=2935761 RepID=A0AAP0MKI8_9ROSI